MIKTAGIIATCMMLAACSGGSSQAQDAVRASLKDSDSAKFGSFQTSADGQRACLGVNAKNSMGGYTGEQQAHLSLNNGKWEVDKIEDHDGEGCKIVWLAADGGMMSNDTLMSDPG